jgi:NAD(P)H-nitrite reductase large subunit
MAMAQRYPYIIVGSQLAGITAVDGIRELDEDGPALVLGREADLPYDRPPLSKALWSGKKTVEQIVLRDPGWYGGVGAELRLGVEVVALDPEAKTVTDSTGIVYQYERLLLATGGRPRRLGIPGDDLPNVHHYRTLGDYTQVRGVAREGATACIVGGGFIGSEMAAALHSNGVGVTMIYGGPYLCDRVFPPDLGRALEADYQARGIVIHSGDVPVALDRRGRKVVARTEAGPEIAADFAIVGIGIVPETDLAREAGLAVDNGIIVDDHLRTSRPDIYAAGDAASFPYLALDARMRVEHWDHALSHGKQAGRNMAGADEPYTHMPYFFSDLFEFGYEAVGDVDGRHTVYADWQDPYKTGVVYYLAEGVVRGVLLCNVWDKVDEARALVREKTKHKPEVLSGAIR